MSCSRETRVIGRQYPKQRSLGPVPPNNLNWVSINEVCLLPTFQGPHGFLLSRSDELRDAVKCA